MTDHLPSIHKALYPVCSTEKDILGWPVIEMQNHSKQEGVPLFLLCGPWLYLEPFPLSLCIDSPVVPEVRVKSDFLF